MSGDKGEQDVQTNSYECYRAFIVAVSNSQVALALEEVALRCFVWVVFLGKKAQNASLRSIKKPA